MVKEPDVKEGEPPGPVAPPLWPFIPPLVGATGIVWAYFAVNSGIWGDVFGIVPAVLLISPSLSNVFSGGDARLSQFMCLGAFLGMILSFPMMFVAGVFVGVILLVLSAASFVAAGYLAVGEDPVPVDVPEPGMGVKLSASAASDEVKMTAIILTTWPHTVGSSAARVSREVDEALELFAQNGWLEEPGGFHVDPVTGGERLPGSVPPQRLGHGAPDVRERLRAVAGRTGPGPLARPQTKLYGPRPHAPAPGRGSTVARVHPRSPERLAAQE